MCGRASVSCEFAVHHVPAPTQRRTAETQNQNPEIHEFGAAPPPKTPRKHPTPSLEWNRLNFSCVRESEQQKIERNEKGNGHVFV